MCWQTFVMCLQLRAARARLQRLLGISKKQKRRFGSPKWIRTTVHGVKGRCPTIRRSGSVCE